MIRVVIADDHAIVREGIKRTLADAENVEVVGEAGDSTSLLGLLGSCAADVIVLDLAMPGTNGLELLEEVRRRAPNVAVLVLSMYPAEQYAVRVIRAGASGYINKARPPAELVTAIRTVAARRRYVDAETAETLAAHIDATTARLPHESLSNREFQVMCLIAQGKSVSNIAEELILSVKTVSTYRTRILEKLGVKHNAGITRYALKHRLVD